MEDESPLSSSTHVALTLAGVALVGVASCFSGGLALLGLAGLFVTLAATSRPEPDHCAPFIPLEASGTGSPEPSPEALPCPSPAVERGGRWQEAVAARRRVAPGRCTSV